MQCDIFTAETEWNWSYYIYTYIYNKKSKANISFRFSWKIWKFSFSLKMCDSTTNHHHPDPIRWCIYNIYIWISLLASESARERACLCAGVKWKAKRIYFVWMWCVACSTRCFTRHASFDVPGEVDSNGKIVSVCVKAWFFRWFFHSFYSFQQ